jgi:hypothetical protein
MADKLKKAVNIDLYIDTTPDDAVEKVMGALRELGGKYLLIYDNVESGDGHIRYRLEREA